MYIVLINHLDGRDVDVDDLRGVGPVVQQAAAHAALGRADCVRVTFVWSFLLLKQLTHVFEYIYMKYIVCIHIYAALKNHPPVSQGVGELAVLLRDLQRQPQLLVCVS